MIERHGMQFHDGTDPVTMTLAAYSNSITIDADREERALLMLEAMRLLWPDKVYRINSWTERRVRTFCKEPTGFFTMWGPSSAGKSTDMAAIILAHWLAAPAFTTCTVCSTTKPALEQRIFGEIVKLYSALKDPPGSYIPSKTKITLGDDNSKNGIFGVAILIGSIKDAMSNMVGKHNRRNLLLVDEMQGTREAAVEAVSNLQGGEDFHFIGIGNPESRLDPLGRYSEPVAGWDSIHPGLEEWKTKWGCCIFFDGRKSPAIVEPNGARLYPYLLKQADIDQRIAWYGENSPKFWSQTIGFIPPEGLIRSIFTESFFIKHGMIDKVEWERDWIMVAGLDPSFSTGGDRCILSFAKVGKDKVGVWKIEFCETVDIPMVLNPDEPLSYSTARKVGEACDARGVVPVNLAIDTTGNQTALADIIETEWGRGIMRISSNMKPSALPISTEEDVPANQRYANRVTELWYNLYQYGRHGHIGGIEITAVKEFCSRILLDKLNPVCIEPKSSVKGRTGKSPDDADSKVLITALVRERMGITPGAGEKVAAPPWAAEQGECLDDPNRTYAESAEDNFIALST